MTKGQVVPPVPPVKNNRFVSFDGEWWQKYHLQFDQVFCAQSGAPLEEVKDKVLVYMIEHALPVLCVLDKSLPEGDAWSVIRLRTPSMDQYVLRWSQQPYRRLEGYYCFTMRELQ